MPYYYRQKLKQAVKDFEEKFGCPIEDASNEQLREFVEDTFDTTDGSGTYNVFPNAVAYSHTDIQEEKVDISVQ